METQRTIQKEKALEAGKEKKPTIQKGVIKKVSKENAISTSGFKNSWGNLIDNLSFFINKPYNNYFKPNLAKALKDADEILGVIPKRSGSISKKQRNKIQSSLREFSKTYPEEQRKRIFSELREMEEAMNGLVSSYLKIVGRARNLGSYKEWGRQTAEQAKGVGDFVDSVLKSKSIVSIKRGKDDLDKLLDKDDDDFLFIVETGDFQEIKGKGKQTESDNVREQLKERFVRLNLSFMPKVEEFMNTLSELQKDAEQERLDRELIKDLLDMSDEDLIIMFSGPLQPSIPKPIPKPAPIGGVPTPKTPAPTPKTPAPTPKTPAPTPLPSLPVPQPSTVPKVGSLRSGAPPPGGGFSSTGSLIQPAVPIPGTPIISPYDYYIPQLKPNDPKERFKNTNRGIPSAYTPQSNAAFGKATWYKSHTYPEANNINTWNKW